MSESRQRLICRLAFFFGCLLPTAIVVWFVVSPGRTARWESSLQDALGLQAQIKSVATPLPGVTELHQVSLHDFQAGHLLDLAEIKLVNTPQETHCRVSEFKIEARELGALLGRVNSLLEKKSSGNRLRVRFDRINVFHRNPHTNRILSQSLGDCLLSCQETASGKRIAFDFKLSSADAQPCQIAIVVDRANDACHVKWTLKTNGASIPCWIVAGWLRQLTLLGDDCTFSGEVTGGSIAEQPFAQIKGTFANVDLSRLVQQSFPHEMTGMATIELQKCLVTEQGILKADGSFRSQQEGLIGPTLLAAARQYLSMRTPQDLPNAAVPFAQFEIHFETRNETEIREGLETRTVEIDIRGNAEGDLVLDSYGLPLLRESGAEFLPIGNLLQTFLPDGQQQALANPQCRQLLALFPHDARLR